VGINDYPQESDRLEGCVNDVFLMSSVLQEGGFPPESIRVCLDERATAKGITDRLRWLLDDPRPGDERVFYYSGHGATIPEYGENLEPDRKAETLVPWDFDWSPERAIVDDQIYALYSQLPYGTRFAMILDCCHSGGMHRQGGPKVRGLSPPDDIRHRELKWSKDKDMWVDRDWRPLNKKFSSDPKASAAFFGKEGVSTRLGRASLVRSRPEDEYKREKRRVGSPKLGPFLPLIIEACQEKQFSYEYRHGVTSYGAFTYSMCLELRARKRISFDKLVDVTKARLKELKYDQEPQILGPAVVRSARVPWVVVGLGGSAALLLLIAAHMQSGRDRSATASTAPTPSEPPLSAAPRLCDLTARCDACPGVRQVRERIMKGFGSHFADLAATYRRARQAPLWE
jgi:hypothetical protein